MPELLASPWRRMVAGRCGAAGAILLLAYAAAALPYTTAPAVLQAPGSALPDAAAPAALETRAVAPHRMGGGTSPAGSAQEDWIQLFNGRDLSGWTPKITGYELGDNFGDTFRVEDGVLKVAYDRYDDFAGRFGHLFHEGSFSHYRLRIEYRFVGEQAPGGPGWAVRNSGVMIHGEAAAAMTVDQEFPTSIEVQFLGGDGSAARPTANLCTPGTNVVMEGELVTRHCTNAAAPTFHGDQWVTVEVEVHGGDVIRHLIDGDVVLEYEQPQLDESDDHARALVAGNGGLILTGGTISLQSESHPIEFRRVELLPLDEAEPVRLPGR